jgi:ribosomal protein L11 methyltransferase
VVRLEAPARLEETLVGLIGDDCLGVGICPAEQGRIDLAVYTASLREASAIAQRIEAFLGAAGLGAAAGKPRVESLEDGGWVERYQAGLRPFPLGRRFIVYPTGGAAEPLGDRTPIRLVPGRAFGTGEHATTRLCAEALERRVRAASRWIDLGCGTAILSVVAFRCGAGAVLALDTDPDAVDVATEVLRENAVADRVEIGLGSCEQASPGSWDGVVANVSGAFLRASAGSIAALLRPRGWLVGSGFSAAAWPDLLPALGGAGLVEVERHSRGPWSVVICRRTDGSP